MSWNYDYTPIIWPSLVTFLMLVALSVYSWRRRSVPGALPFTIACLFAATVAAGSMIEAASVDLVTKISWFKFQAVIQLPIPIALTCFILEYAWPGRWLTRRVLFLLSFPVLLGVGMILTNDLHHLYYRGLVFNESVQPQIGPGSSLLAFYFFGFLGVVNLIVFGWLFLHSPQHRWPVALMLVGQVSGRMLFMVERVYLLRSVAPLDLLGMSFEFLMYAIALFGFRILDPIPLARRTAIEQLQSGMLVLDPQGQVVSLNPAAAAILGSPARRLLGRPIQDLLPAYIGDVQAAGAVQFEICLGSGAEIRSYQLEASALNDWRGLPVGRLLLLHDVTEQRRAQARLLEQQRALAMLHEREQLARELHDSTGQVLGYAGFQLEVVHDRIQDGQEALSAGQVADVHKQLAEAENQLTRLRSIVEETHADMREYILNLRLAPSDQRPFFATLHHYLDGFSQNYDIQTELSVGPGIDEEKFDPEEQMQLFRIIQEALSNARKHAGASCVQVGFEKQDHLVRIHIQDNGQGFDPALTMKEGGSHFGLRFMHERAEQMGGNLRVQSAPGAGTCIEVDVPLGGEAGTRREGDVEK